MLSRRIQHEAITAQMAEQRHISSEPVDLQPIHMAARTLLKAQRDAVDACAACADEIARAAPDLAATVARGGTLYYAAAGSSGLMAAADAMELGGTFGIPSSQVRIVMAGGIPHSAEMPGRAEDCTDTLAEQLPGICATDCLIALSASGTTPFTVGAAALARKADATVVAIGNTEGAELFRHAHYCVLLKTPPEPVSGSTRLGAGTAQKIALNTLSTLMGVALGHVHRGHMVNLIADNDKLRKRASEIVAQVTSRDTDVAAAALQKTEGNVKLACLLICGAPTLETAQAVLELANGHLPQAIAQLKP